MSTYIENTVDFSANSRKALRVVVIVFLVSLLAACGSPAKKQAAVTAAKPKQSCSTVDATKPKPGEASQPVEAQQKCLPKGVIEISENFGVDPEIREQFNQAIFQLEQGKFADAIRLLKGVVGKTSKFSAPFINLGIAYARTEEMEKAEESLQKALEISQLHPVASNELGLVYRKTGRYQEARQVYESLLSAYPDFLPARKNLGVLCDIYIQDLNCAMQQYEEYLKGVPGDEKVQIWVADVKSRM